MTKLLAGLALALSLGGTAAASQDRIHGWDAATIVTTIDHIGRVTITAAASSAGHVTALAAEYKTTKIVVPAAWLAKLPALRLSTLEITSLGTGRDYHQPPKPAFRASFKIDSANDTATILFFDGTVTGASITRHTAKGSKTETIAAP